MLCIFTYNFIHMYFFKKINKYNKIKIIMIIIIKIYIYINKNNYK